MKDNGAKRILVIEDDAFLMDAYKVKLQQSKYGILFAQDGEAGLDIARRERPDVIILDLVLPKMSGVDVLKALKDGDDTKDIPVIVASNLDQKKMIEETKALGAADYFIKSNISINELIEKLDSYLSKP
ncbi:MAG: response regulator [Candidatus Moraniibacteriota bacterium]|nr:MAG: response regulator [Candidatus Moranbacteria bacterium]